jgi:hypothetical protein
MLVSYRGFLPHTLYSPNLRKLAPTTSLFLASPAPVRLHYLMEPTTNTRPALLPPECPVPVLFTSDPRSADAVVGNVDRLDFHHFRREKGQLRVVSGTEPGPYRPALWEHHMRKKEAVETYEAEMTYRLDSIVPSVYA